MTTDLYECSSLEVGGGVWRYRLKRLWNPALPVCTFVMLNPSTANGERDDPTIRACVRWAQALGCGALEVVNLFAYRATDPKRLLELRYVDAVGRHNDVHIRDACDRASVVVCAWGALSFATKESGYHFRAQYVTTILAERRHELMCLGINADGSPKHPLARGRHRVAFDASLVRRYF